MIDPDQASTTRLPRSAFRYPTTRDRFFDNQLVYLFRLPSEPATPPIAAPITIPTPYFLVMIAPAVRPTVAPMTAPLVFLDTLQEIVVVDYCEPISFFNFSD